MKKLLNEAIAASLVFDRLLEGFLGLGLIVGVAALGVVTARAVVERRQQIGVLRAIGYQRRMVQASLLIESSFIALTAILVGTVLGLIVAYNVIHSSAANAAELGDEPELHRPLAHPRRDLPRRLPRRARDHAHPRPPRRARLPGRSTPLPVGRRWQKGAVMATQQITNKRPPVIDSPTPMPTREINLFATSRSNSSSRDGVSSRTRSAPQSRLCFS